jgi:hypothetical protein
MFGVLGQTTSARRSGIRPLSPSRDHGRNRRERGYRDHAGRCKTVAQRGDRFYSLGSTPIRRTSDHPGAANIEFVLQRSRERLRPADADCVVPPEEPVYATL